MSINSSREYAEELDRVDNLAAFKARFTQPALHNGREPVYLCGNSLGLQPKSAADYVNEVLKAWEKLAVHGHFHGARPWTEYHRLATKALAQLTGSKETEVIAMNTLTVNLHLLLSAFYRPAGERSKVLIESTAFPSDRFAVASQIQSHGLAVAYNLLEWTPRASSQRLHMEDLEQLLDQRGAQISVILLPGVQYYSGELLDIAEICRLGKKHGCVVGLDLAHSVGNVPVALHDAGADFAAWCSYKYLNGGPGAVGGAFIHERHLGAQRQLLGWWGHHESSRFQMGKEFIPAPGAEAWQMSNPPILSLAPVVASLDIFQEAGIERLREKSQSMTGYLEALLDAQFAGRIQSITPSDARGCQLSLIVVDKNIDGRALYEKLGELNVIIDWREPDVMRVAPVPLYNSYLDIYEFVQRLQLALAEAD